MLPQGELSANPSGTFGSLEYLSPDASTWGSLSGWSHKGSFPSTLLGIWGILTVIDYSALALLCLDELLGGDWLVSVVRSCEIGIRHLIFP